MQMSTLKGIMCNLLQDLLTEMHNYVLELYKDLT